MNQAAKRGARIPAPKSSRRHTSMKSSYDVCCDVCQLRKVRAQARE